MFVVYFRSSSYNAWDFCQHRYFLEYVLGYRGKSNLAAQKGTVVHKVMEILANAKLMTQVSDQIHVSFKDDDVGDVSIDTGCWMEPSILSQQDVLDTNKLRGYKSIYKYACGIQQKHKRYGVDIVNSLFDQVYDYYSTESEFEWSNADYRHCKDWMWLALDYAHGSYDPRKRTIMSSEKAFDVTIPHNWAKYSYEIDGEQVEGNLAIKGTIDLIYQLDNDTLEILDWKTGQRKNWNTGEEKTYEKLQNDPQLMMYYYAIKQLYPQFKNFIVTIFFIRHGGPFTICFDESAEEQIEHLLKRRFNMIQTCSQPKLLDWDRKNFKCQKMCSFNQNGMCEQIRDSIREIGITETYNLYKNPDYDITHYNAPGGL